MGVNICICNKHTENLVKESSIDCYKKSDQSYFANVITVNNNININNKTNSINEDNLNEKKMKKLKYKKMFNESGTNSNNAKHILSSVHSYNINTNQTLTDEKYIQNIIKIQSIFRTFLEKKKIKKKKDDDDDGKMENEDSLSLRINLEMAETVFSSNSFRNSHISQDNTTQHKNKDLIKKYTNREECDNYIPFNIKNKLKMHYKYSGYVKKKLRKRNSSLKNNNSEHSNLLEKKDVMDNEEKSGTIKEGFGKFIFYDGAEFCGIFHDNVLQKFGKYSIINQKNNNILQKNDKEVIITGNVNYEEFCGEYKDYVQDGFGIYKNYITNIKITGSFNYNGIFGVGIEESLEGGYIYAGEFNNNKKEGYGTIIWKDGAKYEGEFKDNQINGYGIIEFPEQKYYQGEIKKGRMEGFGEFFWKDEKKYIGNYKNDKRNGFGVLIFKANSHHNSVIANQNTDNNDNYNDLNNFCAYVGFWKNGNMDGFGMKVNCLEIKYGLWENGNKRRYLETNFALKTYIKWIDKKYAKLFLGHQSEILSFLEKCLNIDSDIYPVKQEFLTE